MNETEKHTKGFGKEKALEYWELKRNILDILHIFLWSRKFRADNEDKRIVLTRVRLGT